jgi:signal transduction histidine kinase/CheY-like chemotaxis protein
MSVNASFFNFSLREIIRDEQPVLDQVKIRLLYNGFWIVFLAVSGLLVGVYFQRQQNLTLMAGCVLVCLLFLFKYLTYRPHWQQISHAVLMLATLINFIIVYGLIQTVDIITVQVILLTMLFSYYMLGQRWGLFYSVLNLVPVIFFLVLKYNGYYQLPIKTERIGQGTIITGLFASFTVIIFIHSHFYRAFIENIKQLKQTSDEQIELNKKLEAAIQTAEKSSKVKSEFLSTISHEIRTPLNAVMGVSNLLSSSSPRPDQRENIHILKNSVNTLLSIINDVLDFNVIESGKIVFENSRFNLAELLQNIAAGQIVKAEEKDLGFNLEIDPLIYDKIVFGDQTRLNQILFNLVCNAIKYTNRGTVWVKASVCEEKQSSIIVNFTVKDTGIGIATAMLGTIFEPFNFQSATSNGQFGGAGLGLPIVKRLLELQGIPLQVSSNIGEGSEFSFRMGFLLSAETAVEAAEKHFYNQQHERKSPLRVLIAEDNPINVILIKKLLSRWNIKPTIAENGERAIELLLYDNFDIILMDLQMPILDGYKAAIEIRKLRDPKKSRIPIIALTASGLHDIKERVLNSGMNDYVSKPFKPGDLMDKIHSYVADVY